MSACDALGLGLRRATLALVLLASAPAFAQIAPPSDMPSPGAPTPAQSGQMTNSVAEANRQFVKAMQAIRLADRAYDPAEQSRQLLEADRLLTDIVTRLPESPLAVQLVTNQFIGDFDYVAFKARVRGLSCAIADGTECILHRISQLMSPLEDPVSSPRWDWLSMAVAQHHLGNRDIVPSIIAPFLEAMRRGTAAVGDGSGSQDLFLGRALALTGNVELALKLTRGIDDCSTRVYNLTDISEIEGWRGEMPKAAALAEEAADYARTHSCAWELGLVAQALLKTGAEARARTLFLNTVEEQFSRFKERKGNCCPPELAVAAGDLGDTNLALGLLRTVQDESPWTVPQVLGKLATRGEFLLTNAYAEQLNDVELKAETLAELAMGALVAGNRPQAEEFYNRIGPLHQKMRNPLILVQKARAEKKLFPGNRWRQTFLGALAEAEGADAAVERRDITVPFLSALVEIETGRPMLQ